MTATEKRRALGRGLDALLPEATTTIGGSKEQVFTCPIERIIPQKGQPRQHFDDVRLSELAQSIKEHGVLEPLIVRRVSGDATTGMDKYEIIAGERRWRAAQRAGLHELLVVVKDVTPEDTFELAIIENIQREDLNPLELAEAFDRLIKDHHYTQEVLAERVGKDRTTIANSLRLLKLPPKVRHMVIEGALSEGHARALLGAGSVDAMEKLAERVAKMGLSVRDTERLVRTTKPGGQGKETGGKKSPSVRDLEERLARHLGTRVEIDDESGKGAIAIKYGSLDELDRILDLIFK
jgi:ParB family chromosome partitioning protein